MLKVPRAHGELGDDPLGDEPRHWLGSTPLLDLDDPKLRLKARALTQLAKTPREKAMAVYGFVKRLPIVKGAVKTRFRTAREVIEAGSGDADDKATVFVALLRAAGIPARLRYVELRGELLRGLLPRFARASRPVAEIWIGRWVCTDTYIYDASFMAAARQRLKNFGWDCGYGIHVAGHSLWNGADDALLSGAPPGNDPYAVRTLPPVSDPQGVVELAEWRAHHRLLTRVLLWNFLSRRIGRVYRELREEASRGVILSRPGTNQP